MKSNDINHPQNLIVLHKLGCMNVGLFAAESETSLVKIVSFLKACQCNETVLNMNLHHAGIMISFIQLGTILCQSRPSEGLKPSTASGIAGQSSSLGESDKGYNITQYTDLFQIYTKNHVLTSPYSRAWLRLSSTSTSAAAAASDSDPAASEVKVYQIGISQCPVKREVPELFKTFLMINNHSNNRQRGGSRYDDVGLISSIRDFFSFGFGRRKSCAPSMPCR